MKLINLRKELKSTFKDNEIDEADVDFIICEILDVKRTDLTLIDDVDDKQEKTIREKCELRLQGKPVDKIFNKAYFYGLEFIVNENVLTPRPESELLIDKALELIKENNFTNVLDMCTGSGCLAVAVKKNVDVEVTAVDISAKALDIAKQNANKNEADIKFIRSNMFEKVDGTFDVIISNPPYIDSDEVMELDDEVKNHDPILALDGGALGLKFYNILHDNIKKYLNNSGFMILEIGNEQKDMILNLFVDCHFVECIKDYSGHDRIMVFKK